MTHSSQFIPNISSPAGEPVDRTDAMEVDEANASSSSTTGSPIPDGSTLNSQTSSATSLSTNSDSQNQARRRSSSSRRPSFSRVRLHAASAGVKLASGMIGLPVIGELLENVCNSVRDYENMGSNRQGLAEFKQRLEALMKMLNSEPQLLDTDREYAYFARCIENLHNEVNNELHAIPVRRLDAATRLDNFNRELTDLLANAIKAGHIVQKRVVVPEEFDRVIPSVSVPISIPNGLHINIPLFQLKIVNERNGLVISEHISTRRYDGTPVDDSRAQLHVYTYQAMYNDAPVEVEDYCGGPDNYLIRTLTELVDNYNQRGLNPVLQQLHGGSVFKDQSGRLHACLVLSPREGTSWVKLVKAKQSVELLCQVAEKTAIIFKQLKQNKQMNDEDIFGPSSIGRGRECEIDWPFDGLCRLLHESSKQGLVREAVAALREHDGTWDQIAVWRVSRDIGLRPPPSSKIFNYYPPRHWMMNPGWIIHWPDPSPIPNDPNECFNPVARLPEWLIEEYEHEHLTSFMITLAMGKRGDECISYFKRDGHENWLEPAEEKDWECFSLEPWQGVECIRLRYESVRLELVEWAEWRCALEKIAERKKDLPVEDLGVVSRTDVLITIDKMDVPELGTRPIYFYRRKLGADTSPEQFWGFFTFNQDPLGPTGLTVRRSGPNQRGRIVSESLPPDPPGYEQNCIELEMCVPYLYST
ncbi:unnamed protein product [Rhizoctonia solani]|uniref:Uncharacterized protein n=1 Tax=Rhizoctonia solani TaxID=456999 RepID=A0A8H3CUF3_9AGAM|nr:unnamed protein product [Rhizoctonia solani]